MLPGELDGAKFLRAMGRFGWVVTRTSGSHRILKNAAGRTLIVAFHSKLSRNSVRRALREAFIAEDEFERKL